MYKAKNPANTSFETELLLADAGVHLLKATKNGEPTVVAYRLVDYCVQQLIDTPKDRMKDGKAAYHVAGNYMKHGGSYKSWKARFFVCDDTKVSYYKDQQEWEKGPVAGVPKEPQGFVDYADIVSVSTHDGFVCEELSGKRPKGTEATYCLHVVTLDRTYNLIGFASKDETEKWVSKLRFAVKCHNVKKRGKSYLKQNKSRFGKDDDKTAKPDMSFHSGMEDSDITPTPSADVKVSENFDSNSNYLLFESRPVELQKQKSDSISFKLKSSILASKEDEKKQQERTNFLRRSIEDGSGKK